jgi:hypothetical protein
MDACGEYASFPNINQTPFDDAKLMSATGDIWDRF